MYFRQVFRFRNLHSILLNVPIQNNHYCHLTPTPLHMADKPYPGKPLAEIIKQLETFAPLNLAETWDNVGLLVDPMENLHIKHVLLTNDLTEDVLEEAIKIRAGLIISYHPNIFQGLKSVTSRTWKERIVIKCIKNNIAVFSPHTSWDSVQGGVNDWLTSIFHVNSSVPIIKNSGNPLVGVGRFCSLMAPISLKQALSNIKAHIGLPHVQLAAARGKTDDDLITSVAVCAGSGNSVLKGIKADLYLTGEMFHHYVLDATQNGTHVVLCNHSDSERGFLKRFQHRLQTEILKDSVGIFISSTDCDPLSTV